MSSQIGDFDVPLLMAGLKGADFNTTADQAITISPGSAARYIISQITVTNASAALTLAAGGFYTAPSKGGVNLVAATQVYSALTGATKFVNVALLAILTTDTRSEATLYFSLTTAQGSPATADIYIWGYALQ